MESTDEARAPETTNATEGPTVTVPRPPITAISGWSGRPIKMTQILGHESVSRGLKFPVLVSRPGCPVAEVETSSVYPIATMAPRRASPDPLAGEIGRLTIGRGSDCDIVIDEVSVSRRHAALIRHPGDRWSLMDLGSLNGTYLDGEALAPFSAIPIAGDTATLRVGVKARFAFFLEPVFREYLDSVRSEVDRHRISTTHAGTHGPKSSAPLPKAVAWHPVDEFLGAMILDAVRNAPIAGARYRLALEGALVEEVTEWTDLVALVETRARDVLQVEVAPSVGRGLVVYRRPRLPGYVSSHDETFVRTA